MQQAINEIYQSFVSNDLIPLSQSIVMKLIPAATQNNHPPMFKLADNGKLMCRTPLGGNPVNQYTELTNTKALEILAYHAEIYVESSVNKRIVACKKKLESVESSIKSEISQLG